MKSSAGFALKARTARSGLHIGRAGPSKREDVSMAEAIIWLVNSIIGLMILFIIISAIASWLVAFDVINTRNRAVYSILTFLDAATRPLMEPFRRIIPPLGGIDITPIIVLLGLQFLRMIFNNTAAPALYQLFG
jgi:YggT family protein